MCFIVNQHDKTWGDSMSYPNLLKILDVKLLKLLASTVPGAASELSLPFS
jgi:hypothetical protein